MSAVCHNLEKVQAGAGFDFADGDGLAGGGGLVGEDDGIGGFGFAAKGEHDFKGGAGNGDVVGADVLDVVAIEESAGEDDEGVVVGGEFSDVVFDFAPLGEVEFSRRESGEEAKSRAGTRWLRWKPELR